jgi:phage terminase small subunit
MKRGRASAAQLSVVPIAAGRKPISPPDDLDASTRKLFVELVSSLPHDHFHKSDIPLLVTYCNATVISQKCYKGLLKDRQFFNEWERACRTQATLATRLRLAPQSRNDPKTVGMRQRNFHPSIYASMGKEDD